MTPASVVDDLAFEKTRSAINKTSLSKDEFLPVADGASIDGSLGLQVVAGDEIGDASSTDFLRDLKELLKPRISSMVLVTVALSGFVAAMGRPDVVVLLHCLVGTALVATSSGAFNQWLEKDSDAKMPRTQDRPLPAGRMTVREVIVFGTVTLIAGVTYLAATVGWWPTMWAIATWLVYVIVYTPMKSRTSWNTTVGAVSGALPIFIGASATASSSLAAASWPVIAMFCILFFWQFPHFIAIAWIYRKQYAQAGLVMVTTTNETGQTAGRYSVLGAGLLFATSFLPLLAPMSIGLATSYTIACFALGVYQMQAAFNFRKQLNDASARELLKASIIYLPLALGLIAVQTAL